MSEYTNVQLLLMQLRKERCGNNSAELARKIGKDATYVHRLFYPIGKKGAKGVGLEIMQACTAAFGLPPGFWEGVAKAEPTANPEEATHSVEDQKSTYFDRPKYDEWTLEAIGIMEKLNPADRKGAIANLRSYVQNLGPPCDGQTLHMAVK